jgi:hypothetical protein
MNGAAMTFIPFIIHGGIDVKPVFLGEVLDLNVHHWQLSADEIGALHVVGQPTPWVSGVSADEAPTCFGPNRFIVLEDPQANIGILEFVGQGLDSIANKLKVFEETIATITASTINKSTQMTATQAGIDFANNTASLTATVNKLSSEISFALTIAAEWMGKQVGGFSLSTDFISSRLSAQDLTALLTTYMQGAISWDTFWENLQTGEIADPNKAADEELATLETSTPPGMVENMTLDNTNNADNI